MEVFEIFRNDLLVGFKIKSGQDIIEIDPRKKFIKFNCPHREAYVAVVKAKRYSEEMRKYTLDIFDFREKTVISWRKLSIRTVKWSVKVEWLKVK